MGSDPWRVVLLVVLVPAGLYLLYAAFLFFFQAKFVYYPQDKLWSTPASIGLPYEPVSLVTSDGITLSAWFVPAEDPRGTVLFCHGNAGNISHRLESIEIFYQLDLNVFIFDYRGYGQSAGRPSEQGTYGDAEAAWTYLVQERGIAPSDIVLFGRSLGGAVAAWLAQERAPGALILESTFTSVPDLAAKLYPIFPVRLLARFRYDARHYLANVDCPVLVVHSPDDELIPFEHGQALYEAAGTPKEFLQIGGTHNEGFIQSGRRYREGLDRFLDRHARHGY